MPPETSHISVVQTPVKASGKKSRTVFFLPKLSLRVTSSRPWAVLVLRVKSGALVPILRGMVGEVKRLKAEVRRKRPTSGRQKWPSWIHTSAFTLLTFGQRRVRGRRRRALLLGPCGCV